MSDHTAVAKPKNLLYTGGALGADDHFTSRALWSGFPVNVMSFQGHKRTITWTTPSDILKIVNLSDRELRKAAPYLEAAAKKLGRDVSNLSSYTNKLLLRDFFQIEKVTGSVYAIGFFDDKNKGKNCVRIERGTAWASQMFIDRQPFSEEPTMRPLYFYAQNHWQWFQCQTVGDEIKWVDILEPPKPTGICAGIGTRDLYDKGAGAIERLFK